MLSYKRVCVQDRTESVERKESDYYCCGMGTSSERLRETSWNKLIEPNTANNSANSICRLLPPINLHPHFLVPDSSCYI